jgi:hypothetical protein
MNRGLLDGSVTLSLVEKMYFAMGSAQEIGNVLYLGMLMKGLRGTSGLGFKPHMCSHYRKKACGFNTIMGAGLRTWTVHRGFLE